MFGDKLCDIYTVALKCTTNLVVSAQEWPRFSICFWSPQALIDGCSDFVPYISYTNCNVSSGRMNMHGGKSNVCRKKVS